MNGWKKIKWLMLMLTVALALGILAGCGGQEPEVEDTLAGSWMLSEMQMGEKSYSLEELAEAVNSGSGGEISILLDIDAEGGFVLHTGDAKEPVAVGQYSADEADGEEAGGYLFSVDGGNRQVKAFLEEGKLVLHDTASSVESKMIFEKKQGSE